MHLQQLLIYPSEHMLVNIALAGCIQIAFRQARAKFILC